MRLPFVAASAISMFLAGAVPAHAQTYSIGTNPQGPLAYSSGAAMAKVVIEATGLKIRVASQGGPVQ